MILAESLTVRCRKWLDTHLKDQWYLGKPVVIEEFGKALGKTPSLVKPALATQFWRRTGSCGSPARASCSRKSVTLALNPMRND